PDDTVASGIGGVLATVHEITEKIQAQRRMAALRELGAGSGEAKSAEEACENVTQVLAGHKKDVPFAMLYLLKGQRARLVSSSGVDVNDLGCPGIFDAVTTAAQVWPVAKVMATASIQVVENLEKKFGTLTKSPWSEPVKSAAIVPLRSSLVHQLAG